MPTLVQRFRGSLLGLAVGDGLGARFEGQSAEAIQSRFPNPPSLIQRPPNYELYYTDDTQMMIGVAETLVQVGQIDEERLYRSFVANYDPNRGYGRGARAVLEAQEYGRDPREVSERMFPGGSYGNGAAMRVAPIGLLFRDDHDMLWEQARLSSLTTHTHPLGIEGAQIVALAVALASKMKTFDRDAFIESILARVATADYRDKLTSVLVTRSLDQLAMLGNRIEAVHSAPTAIACFAMFPDSYEQAVGTAVLLGGDTDTIAAMAGAIAGAFLGSDAIPAHLLDILENDTKGRDYIMELADRLHDRCVEG